MEGWNSGRMEGWNDGIVVSPAKRDCDFSVSSCPPASEAQLMAGRMKLRKRKQNPQDPVNPVK